MQSPSTPSRRRPDPTRPLLAARQICKMFPGVVALDHVDLEVAPGEVLAVIGENGAGKSTLMKILAGILAADDGQIVMDQQSVRMTSPREAQNLGVVLIHQELNLCDNLDVTSNILLGNEPGRFGFLRRAAGQQRVASVLQRVGLDISPRTQVARLSIGQQQLVEIAKALSIDARVLIMDEPTSSLSESETQKLFQVIRDLRGRGVSVIYISHRLREVEQIADRVVVLRDGRRAGQLTGDDIRHDRMVPLMVGRDVSRFYSRSQHPIGDPVLVVDDLTTRRWPTEKNSLVIRQGEIVGLSGLVGSGRTELLNCLFGIDRAVGGTIRMAGQATVIGSPRDAIAAGLALVPEDRKRHGLLLPWTVTRNISLPLLRDRFSRHGLVRQRAEAQQARLEMTRLQIVATGPGQLAGLLSGGNQQKVVIGKWLATGPRLLLLDEPTRGIDVGAKHEIYKLMEQLASQGMAILFASSELEEIIGMSDRVLVMHEGRITGELSRDQASEESIMRLATRHTFR